MKESMDLKTVKLKKKKLVQIKSWFLEKSIKLIPLCRLDKKKKKTYITTISHKGGKFLLLIPFTLNG